MEFLFGLGVFLIAHLVVGLAFAILVGGVTNEQIEKLWKDAGADQFFIPKSYKKFMTTLYILLGFLNIPMYALAVITRLRGK